MLVLVTNYYLHYMTRYVETHTRTIELHIEFEKEAMTGLFDFIRDECGYTIDSVERRSEQPIIDGDTILHMEINMGRKIKHTVIINDIMELEGVHYVEELG